MLGDDVEARLAEVFAEEHLQQMRDELTRYDGKEAARVHLAIIHLSNGDPDELRRMVDVALIDYRDVLFWAEYPEEVEKMKKTLDIEKLTKGRD